MEIFFLKDETVLLTFKTQEGSGWLTNHRLILCKHPPGQLEDQTPEEFWLKKFQKAKIKDTTLTAHFQNKKAKIQLQVGSPSLLKEVKDYIEQAAKNCTQT